MIYLAYFWYVAAHKARVFVECCRLGIPLLGLLHDFSKLSPSEFGPYARYFKKGVADAPKPTTGEEKVFRMAAFLHTGRHNKHHWQYWVRTDKDGGYSRMGMPAKYVREMVADWRAMGDAVRWYQNFTEAEFLDEPARILAECLLGIHLPGKYEEIANSYFMGNFPQWIHLCSLYGARSTLVENVAPGMARIYVGKLRDRATRTALLRAIEYMKPLGTTYQVDGLGPRVVL